MQSFASSLVLALMLAVGADAFLAPSRSFFVSASSVSHMQKSAPKVSTILAAKKKKDEDELKEPTYFISDDLEEPTPEAAPKAAAAPKAKAAAAAAPVVAKAAPAKVNSLRDELISQPLAIPVKDGYAPAPKRLAFADANPTPDPRTGQKKVYPTGKEFFPKANAGDTFPTAPIGHVRPKVPSFADLYPTTPAGIVNPSPKSFAQNNPVLLTGLMDPSVDPSKAEATFQAVYAPPKFKADQSQSFADQFPTTPAARSKLPLTSFAAQYPTTLAGQLASPKSAPATAAKAPAAKAAAAAPALASYVTTAPKKKLSFADLYPTTPAGQVNNPSPKSFAQSYPTTLTGQMAPRAE